MLECALECAGLGCARSIAPLAGGSRRGVRVHHLRQQGMPKALAPRQRGAHRVPHGLAHLALQPTSPPLWHVLHLCTMQKQGLLHAHALTPHTTHKQALLDMYGAPAPALTHSYSHSVSHALARR